MTWTRYSTASPAWPLASTSAMWSCWRSRVEAAHDPCLLSIDHLGCAGAVGLVLILEEFSFTQQAVGARRELVGC